METKLLHYNEIEDLLDLEPKDRKINIICFESAYTTLKKELGFEIEETTYKENQTVKDSRLIINQINISQIISIKDIRTGKEIDDYSLDEQNRTILLYSNEYAGRQLNIEYKSGYRQKTFPDDLKEVLIKLFMIKKNNFNNEVYNKESKEIEIPQAMKQTIDSYRRKSL